VPILGTVDVPCSQEAALQIAILIEHEQRVVTDILVAGEPVEHRLPEQPARLVAPVSPATAIEKQLPPPSRGHPSPDSAASLNNPSWRQKLDK
jgi:hypothetical protein